MSYRDSVHERGAIVRRVWQSLIVFVLTGAGFAHAMDDWYLLEVADAKPACIDVEDARTRCMGTESDVARFEMRSGEKLDLPQGADVPAAWVRFNRMWVHSGSATAALRRSIALERTPMGARLIIDDPGRSYVQSIPLNEWVEMRGNLNPKLWVRVSESQ